MGKLLMSSRERDRLEVLGRVKRGELTLVKASELLGLSYRQAKRVYGRYREQGAAGLVHGLRGRASNRRCDAGLREQVLEAYRLKYGDFGPTLASEYLAREEGLVVGVETLRRWLLGAGLWRSRRSRPVHRRWRARKEHCGELVQMDGSHHDWFEGRRAWAVLMVLVDDATGWTYCRFFESESTAAAFEAFGRYVRQRGLPRSLYVDRDSIYRTTRSASADETLSGEPPATQFGRAMKELGVGLILANSPQAKGRVERRNGVLQDRLVKALRLAEISDLDEANGFLEEWFLPEFNGRFTVAAQEQSDVHRRVGRGVRLERVLSFQEERVVQNDWTVCWRKRRFQLTEANRRLSLRGRRVVVCEELDGTIRLVSGQRELSWQEVGARAPAVRPSRRVRAKGSEAPYKPAADHPWRRRFLSERGSERRSESAGAGVCCATR